MNAASRILLVLAAGLFVTLQVAGQEGKPRAGIAVWDTGQPSKDAISPAALAARAGWTAVTAEAGAGFKGDTVLSNGRILAVLRKDAAVEIYSAGNDQPAARGRLILVSSGGEAASRLEKVTLVENTKTSACVEVSCKSAKGTAMAAKFRLKRGDVSVEAEPGSGAARLRVEVQSRFVVLPDFFADDIVIDASKIPAASAELPSESFVLHLLGKGEAMAMCVFENREQDVKVTLSGAGEKRVVTGSEIEFGKDRKKIWVALLEAPGMWHAVDLKPGDAKKVVPLEWKMPFIAQWRVDFTRTNDLVDSWEMLLQQKAGGEFSKPRTWVGRSPTATLPPDRKSWSTVLGSFVYPCWSDSERQGYLQPLDHPSDTFRGPAVVYPMNRVAETPADVFTVVDVMRNALGVGPCEYILDVVGQKEENKGRATCSTRELLTDIYKKGEQKQRHDEVEKALNDSLTFVTYIRGRITHYIEFGRKTREYLGEQRKAHPEFKEALAELEKIMLDMEARLTARQEKIKTPADVARMNDEFRKSVMDYTGPDAFDRCKKHSNDLVEVGGNQDELVGECRWAVKALRQKAGLLMATDPKLAAIAGEIRTRTQEVLRNPAVHEGARH
jgi:hypothetical protein